MYATYSSSIIKIKITTILDQPDGLLSLMDTLIKE